MTAPRKAFFKSLVIFSATKSAFLSRNDKYSLESSTKYSKKPVSGTVGKSLI